MFGIIRRVVRPGDDRGASAVEYGLLVAAVAALVVVIVFALGGLVQDSFSNTCDALRTNAVPAADAADADCDGDGQPDGAGA